MNHPRQYTVLKSQKQTRLVNMMSQADAWLWRVHYQKQMVRTLNFTLKLNWCRLQNDGRGWMH
jgi:hypothetical protein